MGSQPRLLAFDLATAVLIQKRKHPSGICVAVFFQREGACVEEMALRVLKITPIRTRPFSWEKTVILAPHQQYWGLMGAEQRLSLWVLGDLCAAIQGHFKFDFLVLWAIKRC